MENENVNIVEYLKNLSELEASVYRQNIINAQAHTELNVKPPIFEEPRIEKPQKPKNNKPTKPEEPKKYNKRITWVAIFCLSLIISLIFRDVIVALISICGIAFSLLPLANAIEEKKNYPDQIADYNKKLKQYNDIESQYEKQLKDYDNEYERILTVNRTSFAEKTSQFNKNMSLARQKVEDLDKCLSQTQDILQKAYGVNIVFPKYRNLVAITTIYEYFASGRVSALEGPDGAYNLYEAELRQNLIINQLDTISQNLESIKNNQYSLYIQLCDLNQTARSISTDLSNIFSLTQGIYYNSVIESYCAQVTASNVTCMRSLETMNLLLN